jgi:hypothetical protein
LDSLSISRANSRTFSVGAPGASIHGPRRYLGNLLPRLALPSSPLSHIYKKLS